MFDGKRFHLFIVFVRMETAEYGSSGGLNREFLFRGCKRSSVTVPQYGHGSILPNGQRIIGMPGSIGVSDPVIHKQAMFCIGRIGDERVKAVIGKPALYICILKRMRGTVHNQERKLPCSDTRALRVNVICVVEKRIAETVNTVLVFPGTFGKPKLCIIFVKYGYPQRSAFRKPTVAFDVSGNKKAMSRSDRTVLVTGNCNRERTGAAVTEACQHHHDKQHKTQNA